MVVNSWFEDLKGRMGLKSVWRWRDEMEERGQGKEAALWM